MLLQVNKQDQVLGTVDKWQAHVDGVLHRAFSVLIFNQNGDFLLQQRAIEKYHSGGLWSNSCCGHPTNPADTLEQAAVRLEEELGIQVPLQPLFCFSYKADVGGGLIENEIDHVFIGHYEGPIPFNTDEVSAVAWLPAAALANDITQTPARYTPWFRILHEQLKHCNLPAAKA